MYWKKCRHSRSHFYFHICNMQRSKPGHRENVTTCWEQNCANSDKNQLQHPYDRGAELSQFIKQKLLLIRNIYSNLLHGDSLRLRWQKQCTSCFCLISLVVSFPAKKQTSERCGTCIPDDLKTYSMCSKDLKGRFSDLWWQFARWCWYTVPKSSGICWMFHCNEFIDAKLYEVSCASSSP